MAPRQAVDLGQRLIHRLCVEGLPAAEELRVAAEITAVWAAPRHDEGIRGEVEVSLDQVAAERWLAGQGADRRPVDPPWAALPEVLQELRPGVLARAEEDRVGVPDGLGRERGHVQPAQGDVRAFPPIVIGDLVGAARGADRDLDADQVGLVVESEGLDVLILERDLVIVSQIAGERGESDRRPEGVPNAPTGMPLACGEGRQD